MEKRRAMVVIRERREEHEGSDSIERAIPRAARLFEKFVSRDPGTGALRLWHGNFLSSKETRAAGLTNMPEGGRTGLSVTLENFCLLHIDTMLDETIPDEMLLASLIACEDAEEFGWGVILKEFPDWPVEFDLHLDPKENWPDIDWLIKGADRR